MTISLSIHKLIKLSKLKNNAKNKKQRALVVNFKDMPFPEGISREQQKLLDFLNTLSDHDVIVIRNLMYIGRDLKLSSKLFMDFYAELNETLTSDCSIAKFQISEKTKVLAYYFSELFIYAQTAKIDIDSL